MSASVWDAVRIQQAAQLGTAHVTTDDERRNDALQLIALYKAMTPDEQYREHYDHLDNACPLDELMTNDMAHRLLPNGVGCPLCKDDPSPFEDAPFALDAAEQCADCERWFPPSQLVTDAKGHEELCVSCREQRDINATIPHDD